MIIMFPSMLPLPRGNWYACLGLGEAGVIVCGRVYAGKLVNQVLDTLHFRRNIGNSGNETVRLWTGGYIGANRQKHIVLINCWK